MREHLTEELRSKVCIHCKAYLLFWHLGLYYVNCLRTEKALSRIPPRPTFEARDWGSPAPPLPTLHSTGLDRTSATTSDERGVVV